MPRPSPTLRDVPPIMWLRMESARRGEPPTGFARCVRRKPDLRFGRLNLEVEREFLRGRAIAFPGAREFGFDADVAGRSGPEVPIRVAAAAYRAAGGSVSGIDEFEVGAVKFSERPAVAGRGVFRQFERDEIADVDRLRLSALGFGNCDLHGARSALIVTWPQMVTPYDSSKNPPI